MAPVQWPDAVDDVIGGDLTAALAYVTPAGGAVVTPVAPIGLRDRDAGTVTFTTSLGFGRKLERIRANPRVALAYHAREHGFARGDRFVLVQGRATFDADPDPEVLEAVIAPAATRFMGAPRRGPFWDRWLREDYADRVLGTGAARVLRGGGPREGGGGGGARMAGRAVRRRARRGRLAAAGRAARAAGP